MSQGRNKKEQKCLGRILDSAFGFYFMLSYLSVIIIRKLHSGEKLLLFLLKSCELWGMPRNRVHYCMSYGEISAGHPMLNKRLFSSFQQWHVYFSWKKSLAALCAEIMLNQHKNQAWLIPGSYQPLSYQWKRDVPNEALSIETFCCV